MTEVITFPGAASGPSKAQRESARTRFPPRPVATDWPATRQERGEARERLTSGIFVLPNADSQDKRIRGLSWLLDWLADQPGQTWQERWLASGADAAGRQLAAGAGRLAASARAGAAGASGRVVRSAGHGDLRRSCPPLAELPGGRRGRQGLADP